MTHHGPAVGASVTIVDSEKRIRFGRGAPSLAARGEEIAALLQVGLSARLRRSLCVTSRDAGLERFNVLSSLLASPSLIGVLRLLPCRPAGLCVFAPGTAEALVAGALGARHISPIGAHGSPRTKEQLVLRRLSLVISESIQAAWIDAGQLSVEIVRFETNPRMAAILEPGADTVVCSFEIASACEGGLHVILPREIAGRVG